MSRMNEEKEVKEPQKPVARPIYKGRVFLTALWVLAAALCGCSTFSSDCVVCYFCFTSIAPFFLEELTIF